MSTSAECLLCAGTCPDCGGYVGDAAGSARWVLCSMCHATFTHEHVPFHECTRPVLHASDAIELMLECGRTNTARLLIEGSWLPPDFFDLSTGFAGEFVQKLVNYGIKVGAVIPPDERHSERFAQFRSEARHGNPFRVFDDRAEAEAWLKD